MGRKRARDVNGDSNETNVDEPSKKRRQFSEQDLRLAKLYEDLANEVASVRNEATKSLLQVLDPEKSDSAAIEKCFTRLIRGLCSNRKAARLGFSIALTELLGQTYIDNPRASELSIQSKDLVDLVLKQTIQLGKTSSQVTLEFVESVEIY